MIGVWVAVLCAGLLWLVPERPLGGVVFVVAMTAVLLAVCWIKGEPPRWRWGDERH